MTSDADIVVNVRTSSDATGSPSGDCHRAAGTIGPVTRRRSEGEAPIIRADPWSVGPWLGWLTMAAVVVAVLTDRAGEHRTTIVVLLLAGLVANAATLALPIEHRTVGSPVGRRLLDVWCVAVLGFGATLVVIGGPASDFDWMFVLSVPFIALAHRGWGRLMWLAVGLVTFLIALLAVDEPYPAAGIAFRLVVVAAAAVLVIVMSEAVAHEAEARSEAATRAELEHLLVSEAHHRVKNSLQQVSELLMLARPDDEAGDAFDETAERIRSIAGVHGVLQSTEGTDAPLDAVVRQVAEGIGTGVSVAAEPVRVSAATAQRVGVLVNELVTNAVRHGAPPVSVALTAGPPARLEVIDHGSGYDPAGARLGLRLVRQVVEQGLKGRLEIIRDESGGTVTRVEFAVSQDGAT